MKYSFILGMKSWEVSNIKYTQKYLKIYFVYNDYINIQESKELIQEDRETSSPFALKN